MKEHHQYDLHLFAPDTEFAPWFVQAMANRSAVSFHKYGPIADATTVDLMASAQQRVGEYLRTGNTEFLADACNFLMFQAMRDGKEAFRSTDSDESPGRTRTDGSIDAERNQ